MELRINFVIDRETKNTVRYLEDSPAPKIGTLYIAKLAFPDSEWPNSLTVTVTTEAKPKRVASAKKRVATPTKRSR